MNEMDMEIDALFSVVSLESQPYTFRREKQERLKFKEKLLISYSYSYPYSYQFVNFTVEVIGASHGSGSLNLPNHPVSSNIPPSPSQRITAVQSRLSTEVTLDDNTIRISVPASPKHQAGTSGCVFHSK